MSTLQNVFVFDTTAKNYKTKIDTIVRHFGPTCAPSTSILKPFTY